MSVDEAAERARELAERRARALSTTAAAQTAAGWLVLGGGVVAGAHMWRSTDDDMRLERVGAAGIGVGISVQGVALLIDAGKKRREARRIRASYSCR